MEKKKRANGGEKTRKGRREREELAKRMERLEKRVEEAEKRERRGGEMEERIKKLEAGKRKEEEQGARKKESGTESEEVEERVKEIERKIERREREERRKNVIMKRVDIRGTATEAARRILQSIGVQARLEEVKEVGKRRGGGREGNIEVKMESVDGKAEVIRKKGNLRGRKERIEEDLTWKEKRMQWLIKEIAEVERRKGKTVKVGYGKLFINGTAWFWNEEDEVLRDGRGRERAEERRADRRDDEKKDGRAEGRSNEIEEARGGGEERIEI